MNSRTEWLVELANDSTSVTVEGLIPVKSYSKDARPPEEVAMMEKAAHYGADAVFFEASLEGKPAVAQAFVYRSEGPSANFAKRHQQLWSWGGVPLIYRVSSGIVQLFRCAHRPDFEEKGKIVFQPFRTLRVASEIAADPWWDSDRLRNGTLWDDPAVCEALLSSNQAAQKTLIRAVKELHEELDAERILPSPLRRRLLILSVLVAYLEARKVFEENFFSRFSRGAEKFFQVLSDGPALLELLMHLESRFNGHVFVLEDEDRETLRTSRQLDRFARLVEGRQELGGQLTLWQRYSFADLPVELISHIYQLFVKDTAVAVYTPHFVVRLVLAEALSWERLDRLEKQDEVILDCACGSGIFLVEAYKRLVLHWRYRNGWKRPNQSVLKKLLTARLRGIDIEVGAIELAAFSLCLALCDALEPTEIRASVKLFPLLKEKTLLTGCFFEIRESHRVKDRVGIVVGNPPFGSKLATDGARRAYERYKEEHGALPDKQLAYLFLHESMEMLTPGGALSLLQQYNFLYNQQSLAFRRRFIERWDVREILDFISIRGLFQKGAADTKVIVVVAEAQRAPSDRLILHATFRRGGRADAEQGFDIDYYDLHWLPRELVLTNDATWRSNLLGGGRVIGLVDRLRKFRTLQQYAAGRQWDFGEGFIEGGRGVSRPSTHVIGKPLLPSDAIGEGGIDATAIVTAEARPIEGPRSKRRFTPPMLLIREQYDLHHGLWTKHYLTYKNQTVGLCAPKDDLVALRAVHVYLSTYQQALKAFVAATSVKLFTQHATTLSGSDIFDLPYPESGSLDLSAHEQILVDDIVEYYRDLIRLGSESDAMRFSGERAVADFNAIFCSRINGIYKSNELRALPSHTWPGVICQPFVFGGGEIDWSGADELHNKLDALLRQKYTGGLSVTRIARLYDGVCIYLLKPNQLRYWLRSVALRDADETLADLAEQGF
jgi:hypothetical protein